MLLLLKKKELNLKKFFGYTPKHYVFQQARFVHQAQTTFTGNYTKNRACIQELLTKTFTTVRACLTQLYIRYFTLVDLAVV